jgi:hypothetical protein
MAHWLIVEWINYCLCDSVTDIMIAWIYNSKEHSPWQTNNFSAYQIPLKFVKLETSLPSSQEHATCRFHEPAGTSQSSQFDGLTEIYVIENVCGSFWQVSRRQWNVYLPSNPHASLNIEFKQYLVIIKRINLRFYCILMILFSMFRLLVSLVIAFILL